MSSISDFVVAVNLGGNCGGLRYFSGAMLLLRRGLCVEVEKGSFEDFRYESIEGARAPKRREARVAEMAMKRATAIRNRRESREGARVSVVTWI